jgi:hypothetical protein
VRRREIVAHLAGPAHDSRFEAIGERALGVDWVLGDGLRLHVRANFAPVKTGKVALPAGRVIHAEGAIEAGALGPWSGIWSLEEA